ncbi:MAG: alpha/beta hydrolase [Chloroflexi bacterium]|nr:alpha/beta hydrolase [Chloroflexota bacterium]
MPTQGEIYYFASKGGTTTRPPIVLIHEAGGTLSHWPHNIRRIPDYRIFAPDLPGHGKSGGIGQQVVSAYARIVIDWLQDIGIYRAVFVGHSMGGAIALTLALEYTEHVLGLGLISTGARLRVGPELLEKLSLEGTYPAAVELITSWSLGDGAPTELKKLMLKQMSATRPSVVLGDYVACNAFNLMERIQEIEVPTWVACGTQDRMTPVKFSEYLAEKIPNASLTLVPEAGHMLMLEQPEVVAAGLEDFLGKVEY